MKDRLHKLIIISITLALVSLIGMAQNPMEFQQNMARLQGLTPLTVNQISQCLPESLGDLPRTSISNEAPMPGVGYIKGTYTTPGEPEFIGTKVGGVTGDELNEKRKSFIVEVLDGAGSSGSSMVSSFGMMIGMGTGMAMDDAQKSQKVIERNGTKAQQTYHKQRKQTELQFIYAERFMVTVKAHFLNPDQTWEKVEQLGLELLVD